MKFRATKHLIDRLSDRIGYDEAEADAMAKHIVERLNMGDFQILHNHKDTGFVAQVGRLTVDCRPEDNGVRAVSMVFHLFNQWNNRAYAKAYWPLVLGRKMDKEAAHRAVCAKLGFNPR